jgi:hypothetical protein
MAALKGRGVDPYDDLGTGVAVEPAVEYWKSRQAVVPAQMRRAWVLLRARCAPANDPCGPDAAGNDQSLPRRGIEQRGQTCARHGRH